MDKEVFVTIRELTTTTSFFLFQHVVKTIAMHGYQRGTVMLERTWCVMKTISMHGYQRGTNCLEGVGFVQHER